MLLKFCNDNFIFYITHAKYFNILCYFVILFLVVLFILVQNDEVMEKIKNGKLKKIFIVILSGLFVGFLFFLFAWLLNANAFEGCMTKYNMNIYLKTTNNINNLAEKINNSRVLMVGDSRTELIEDDENITKPFNFNFVAKSGMTIEWFEETAISRIKRILKKDDFQYHVVVNMGVNDLNSDEIDGDEIANDYFELYSEIAKEYPNAKVYVLSVNPINVEKINEWEDNKRTSKKLRLFNSTMQKKLDENDFDNMYYCDSYHDLEFETDDGLHYTQSTNRNIIDYVANKCVQF